MPKNPGYDGKCDDHTSDLCPHEVEKGQVKATNSSASDHTVTLRCGPGWPHNYLLPLSNRYAEG